MTRPIVLIHGALMTPACWDLFVARYQARGYICLAPAWPYDDRPVAKLRSKSAPELADHYAQIVSGLPEPPILIGHSIGGLVVQMLLDRGLGSVEWPSTRRRRAECWPDRGPRGRGCRQSWRGVAGARSGRCRSGAS